MNTKDLGAAIGAATAAANEALAGFGLKIDSADLKLKETSDVTASGGVCICVGSVCGCVIY